jgi:hypothetical protein
MKGGLCLMFASIPQHSVLTPSAHHRFAWFIFRFVVNQAWFEGFIMCNILLIGVATGLDLENGGKSKTINAFVNFSSTFTMIIFSCECILKLITEAYRPQNYFLDPDNGPFINHSKFTLCE